MEDTNNDRNWAVIGVTLAVGLPTIIFWCSVGFIVLGDYQVSWKSPNSFYWSGFNQIDPQAEAQHQIAMIDEDQEAHTSKSMKRLGVK